ncbi:MAG: DeoR/GlpR family DNA-binding transcription regulator [Devosiaceae bacterium]|nr:DeoR/GlpR family DNA-binding transcription regulator [Devosiaceae bacterium]
MHEKERHRIILSLVQSRPVAVIQDLVEMTGASEATIRRDIAALHVQGSLRRVRGGAEAITPPSQTVLMGRPYRVNEEINLASKNAIAREAVALCNDGEAIIINGGTTTYQMVHRLAGRQMQVFTNSFPIAEHLLHHSKNTVLVPGGTIYREQNIILSPFDNDTSQSFYASKMFMGAHAIGPIGVMESDPLLIQAELKLIGQADELIVLADSAKFKSRSSLIVCALSQISTVITDPGISEEDCDMLKEAGVRVIVAEAQQEERKKSTSAA